MKFRLEHFLPILAVAGWALIGWVVVDYNLGLGSTTLRWPNPAHPTAAWAWDARETTPTILEPNSGQWLRVTLPRGFVAGTVQVKTKESATLMLRAESRNANQDVTQTSGGSTHTLSFQWEGLVARGKTFRFRLENPTDTVIRVEAISLTVTR